MNVQAKKDLNKLSGKFKLLSCDFFEMYLNVECILLVIILSKMF